MANKKFSQFTDVISLSPNTFIVGYDSVLNDNIRILSSDLPAIIGAVTGSGTVNKLPKWLTTNALGDSLISDNGTQVTIAGNITSTAFIKVGGTSSQFLKADGSIDSNTYVSLSALSASAPLSYNNLTGNFSIAQAGTITNGYLSAADWNIFNNKQNALSGTGIVKSTAGTISYITDNSTNWNTAYNDSIVSAAVTGTSTKTLTLNQQDGGTVTASWTDENSGLVISVFGRTGAIIAQSGDYSTTLVTEGTNLYYTDARARASFSTTVTGLTYTTATGILSTTAGYAIPTTASQTNWDTAYTQRISSATSPLTIASNTISISQASTSTNGYLSSTDWNIFNNKQVAGNYITALTGEATASGPGSAAITLTNSAVIAKILTGLNITGGSITSSDSILTAFGKVQNQINGLVGGTIYKGTWDASANIPTLTSSVGTQGWYYVVNVAGSTNLNGVTDWKVGDWAIFNGTVWQKVDNTDSVTSVNGFTGAVSLTTTNIPEGTNLYYTDARSRLAFSETVTGLDYNSTTGVLSTTAGYGIPTTAVQANWTTAYNDSIISAAVTGTTTKTLTLNQQDGGTITASWSDLNTDAVTSVFGRTGAVTAQSGDYNTTLVPEGTNLYFTDARVDANAHVSAAYNNRITSATAPLSIVSNVISISQSGALTNGYLSSTDWNTFSAKQNALNGTGLVKSTAGTISYITDNSSNWNTAYNDSIISAAVTGTTTKTLTLTQQDSGTVIASWTESGLTSVGLTMPAAFTVSNSPLTSNGVIAVTAAGLASEYIRGDGTLANFPTSGGGGGGVSYYLNGGTSQGVIGGNTYYEMSKTAVVGTNADFTINADGYIANFITDAGDPALLNIPAGNWNFQIYFSASSSGGTPSYYVELYKYNGTTFTLIASNSANPEGITGGTAIDLYISALAIPTTTLTLTDRLAVRIYVTHSGRTITLHTQGTHLCEVITTFTTGITALNGLTEQVQYFQAGTSGTDFNISSLANTHTFNLPTASATNRGALSSANWSTFNAKQNAITLTTTGTSGAATFISDTLNIPQYQAAGTYINSVTASSPLFSSGGLNPNITIQQASGSQAGYLSATDWTIFNSKQAAGNYITALTGEATATGPGSVAITLSNSAVIAKVLTGLNVTGGTVVATDSILTAFGKVQNQINSLIGGTIYKGTWDALTNNPSLTSSVGTQGWYYIVNVAGSTNLNGITSWNIGDWAIFDGSSWQKVDNTDSVTSVNGFTGAVSLTTTNIAEGTNLYYTQTRFDSAFAAKTTTNLTEGTNLYFTDTRARAAISLTTLGTSGAATYNSGILNIPQYQAALTDPVTGVGTTNYVAKWTSGTAVGNSTIYDNGTFVGIGSTTALGGRLNITFNSTSADAIILKDTRVTGGSGQWRIGPGTGVVGFGIYSDTLAATPFSISNTGASTFTSSVTATSFIKSGGTSSEFLLADGSVTTLPTANWNTAYDNSIISAAVTGTTTKTLTLNQQDGGTITASWTDINTDAVTSVFGRTGAVVATAGDYSTTLVTEGTNLYFTDTRARAAISVTATGLTYSGGVISLTAGYSIPTTASQTTWNTAYNDSIVSAAVTGTTTKTLTLNQQDGGTITASWTDINTDAVLSVFGRTGAVVAVSGDYTTAQVTESGNLYFTNTRAQNAISLTTTGSSGAATYIGGVLNIPNYSTALGAYLPLTGGTLTGDLTTSEWYINSTDTYGIKNSSNNSSFWSQYARWVVNSDDAISVSLAFYTQFTQQFSIGATSIGIYLTNDQDASASILCYQGAGYGGYLEGAWEITTDLTVTGDVIGNVRVTGNSILLNKDYTYDSAVIGYASSAVAFPSSETWGAGMYYDALVYESSYFGINFSDSIDTFRLYETGNILFRGGVFAMNENGPFTTTSIKLGAGSAGAATNNWYINKSNSAGYSIVKNTTTLYSINTSGTHSFYSSTPTLLAQFSSSVATFSTSVSVTTDYISVGNFGLFNAINSSYLRTNFSTSTYGTWDVTGVKGGYNGFVYNVTNLPHTMFDTSGNGGLYYQTGSRWIIYYNYADNCVGIGGATTNPSFRVRINGPSQFSLATTFANNIIVTQTITNSVLGTGTVYSLTGTLTSVNPSDLRLKEDINPLEYGLKEVMALNPVTYKWKDGSNGGQRSTGLIAQDVQEIMPDYVKNISEDNSYLGLDSYAISIVLINAIKELQAEIEILKNK